MTFGTWFLFIYENLTECIIYYEVQLNLFTKSELIACIWKLLQFFFTSQSRIHIQTSLFFRGREVECSTTSIRKHG